MNGFKLSYLCALCTKWPAHYKNTNTITSFFEEYICYHSESYKQTIYVCSFECTADIYSFQRELSHEDLQDDVFFLDAIDGLFTRVSKDGILI